MRYMVLVTVLLPVFLAVGGEATKESPAALRTKGFEALKAAQSDPDRIVEAAKLLAAAADAFMAGGQEAEAQELESYLYWAKKKMTIQQMDAFLGADKPAAEKVIAKLDAVEKKAVKPEDAAAWLARADGFAEGCKDPFLAAVRYFEVASRFKGTPEGDAALEKSLKYIQEVNAAAPKKEVPAKEGTEEPAPPPTNVVELTGAAQTARSEREAGLKSAGAAFERDVATAQKVYQEKLKTALKEAMQAGRLEQANAIDTELKALATSAPPDPSTVSVGVPKPAPVQPPPPDNSARLEKILLSHDWDFIHDLNDPIRYRRSVRFGPGGRLLRGGNDTEASWRIVDGKMEFLTSDGTVLSRFTYDEKTDRWTHAAGQQGVRHFGRIQLLVRPGARP
jgi:hypothetical protein